MGAPGWRSDMARTSRAAASILLGLMLMASPLHAAGAGDAWLSDVKDEIARKNLDGAEKMIVSRMMSAPRDPELITLLAEVRFDQGRFREASSLIGDADRLGGATSERATLAGMVEVSLDHLEGASARFREALSLDPGYAPAHYLLARVLYSQNHFDEAIGESQKAIALSPDLVRAYENIGLCYEGKQQLQEAEHWYLEAIRRQSEGDKRSEWPLLDLAEMWIRNDQAGKAQPYLLQAIAINPNNAHTVFEMAVVLEKSGNLEAALQELKRAIGLDPNLATAYYRAAKITQKLGRSAESQKYFALFQQISETQHSKSTH